MTPDPDGYSIRLPGGAMAHGHTLDRVVQFFRKYRGKPDPSDVLELDGVVYLKRERIGRVDRAGRFVPR